MAYEGLTFKPSGLEDIKSFEEEFVFPSVVQAQEAIHRRAETMGLSVKAYSVVKYAAPSDPAPSDPASKPPANPKQAYGDKKLPVGLVPPSLELEAALNMADGSEKYGPYNWRASKVEAMTYVAAIKRHLASYIDGEDVDPESKRGATHLGAIAACIAILTDARNGGQLIDNRPPKGTAGERIRAAVGVKL